MSLPSLFDYIGDITLDKKYIFDDETAKNYTQFMVNRALGQHIDTVLLANEMNKRPNISKLMHHDFLFHSVDSRKRYGKWAKADDADSVVIEYIKRRYSVNSAIAVEYMNLLDKYELKRLAEESTNKGGKK